MTTIATTAADVFDLTDTRIPTYFPTNSLCSRENVIAVPTPRATFSETGRIWQPVGYDLLLDSFEQALEQMNREMLGQLFSLTADGNRMIAYYVFQAIDGRMDTMALWSSHDKSCAVRIAAGTIYCLCMNGIVSAEIKISRKHTKRVLQDLPRLIHQGVGAANALRINQDQREIAYKNTTLNGDARSLLLDCVHAGGLTRTHFWQSLAMYEDNKGEHWPPEYESLPSTTYRLYQAATTPGMPISQAHRMCERLHSILDASCDFTPATPHTLIEGFEDTDIEMSDA